jgi:hypothetical protein
MVTKIELFRLCLFHRLLVTEYEHPADGDSQRDKAEDSGQAGMGVVGQCDASNQNKQAEGSDGEQEHLDPAKAVLRAICPRCQPDGDHRARADYPAKNPEDGQNDQKGSHGIGS